MSKINTGYPRLQLHRALKTLDEHADQATRERAAARAEKWKQVIANMLSGKVRIGSRTPVQSTPGWLTLEVVTGGFATGELAAGGALEPYELELAEKLLGSAAEEAGPPRVRSLLNHFFISDVGFDQLIEIVRSQHYKITVPEEGALLVAAWMATNGCVEQSQQLIEDLMPFFAKVRFYPQPSQSIQDASDRVFLRSVKSVHHDLQQIETPCSLLAQNESIRVWQPFREKVFAFLLATCKGDPPRLTNDNGQLETLMGNSPQLTTNAHASVVQALVDEYQSLKVDNKLCQKPKRKDNLAQALQILADFAVNGELADSQRSRLRLLCARYVRKRGIPNSDQHQKFRSRQMQQIDGALFVDIAQIVLQRLARLSQDSGLEDFDAVAADVAADEATDRVDAGARVPASVLQKLERCAMESVQVLLDKKIIKSGDSLATVLPQITGDIRATGIACADLRALYAAIYQAFRRRRSLLLLNYEHQVQLEELPWIAVIDENRDRSLAGNKAAVAAASQIARLAMTHFPHAIVPNKLLQEFRAIAKSAEIDMPLVDELAADIFMGRFTNKFVKSAHVAAGLLKGTVYEAYYRIDFDEILAIKTQQPAKPKSRNRYSPAPISAEFANLCSRRAMKGSGGSFVAKNGTIIEQQQIVTTQNLAVFLVKLDLVEEMRGESCELAKKCFRHVCTQLQIKDEYFHARLIKLKNSAYAWRQMLVYLSLASDSEIREFESWAAFHVLAQPTAFQRRFNPALLGLRSAIAACLDGVVMPKSHQPFLGWSLGKHWLLNQTK